MKTMTGASALIFTPCAIHSLQGWLKRAYPCTTFETF